MAAPRKRQSNKPVRLTALGASEDGTELLLASPRGTRATHRIAIDESFVASLEDAHAARGRSRAAAREEPSEESTETSTLSVSEIQNLLRQGRSIGTIAARAGVTEEWVRRWETPIVWERAGIITRARRGRVGRPRSGISRLQLDESVTTNLRTRGVRMPPDDFDSAWDAIKKARGNRWVVSFEFTGRGRKRVARWDFDSDTGQVKALDDLAASLGWVAGPRRRR